MSNPTDLKQIESRIVSFVEDFACLHTDGESDAVAGQCKRLADAVAAQAVTSSEGGKRLRALLTLEAFRAFASSEDIERHIDEVFGLACAIEVFQTGALVHDDIIDDSDLRRGKPSAHRALAAQSGNDAIGHGLGIMLGDMLATSSVDIVNRSVVGLDRGPDIISAFLNMHREVEIGQVLDLAVELSPLNDPDELARTSLNVFRWKTASYTTIAPLEFGMLAAGETKRTARERALAIGLPSDWRSSSRMIFLMSSVRAGTQVSPSEATFEKESAPFCSRTRSMRHQPRKRPNWSACGNRRYVPKSR